MAVPKWLAHIWASFLAIFSNLEHAAKKVYDALPQADKDALVHGSGILAVINSMLDASLQEIRDAVKAHFPDLDEAAMEKNLFQLAKSLGLQFEENSLEDAVRELQEYLKNISEGKIWAGITSGLSLAAALLFGGDSNKEQVYAQLLAYVYKFIVRPKVEQTPIPKIGDHVAAAAA